MEAHNGATEAQTGAMKAHSPEPQILTLGLWKLTPGTMESNHEAIKAFPQAIKPNLLALETRPKDVEAYPTPKKAQPCARVVDPDLARS
jgi:hypothetical protein